MDVKKALTQSKQKKASGLWIVLVIFFFIFGILSSAIAVALAKHSRRKAYAVR
ncbi:MAG: hypothetical protein ACREBF_01965 [Candidatus Micrarchaeales archaeon]